MVKYTNLGFTEREAEVLDNLLSSWQWPKGHSLGRSYVMTEAGMPISCKFEDWNDNYYLSLIARRGNFAVALDTGYGFLFLLDTDTGEASHGQNQVLLNGAVVLDAEHYGLDEFYIYTR
jgi:hypothetical protein